jgi:hypothetical protein
MARLDPRRPDHHHHSSLQPADALKAWLSIILPVISQGQVSAGEDLMGVGKVQTPVS